MVSHEEFKLSDSDYAVRIDLMTKVFGVDAAERYFEGLPPTLKTSETYTALLHSFAREKLVDKAEDLYERAKEANLSLSALTYNEMMTLYMSVGQVQKVPFVIEELKHQKVAPDLFTYNLWISSCAATMDINGVGRILEEMTGDSGSDEGWVRYTTLANIYITSANLVNAEPDASSLVESEKGITQREWITYDFLIILYTGLGNKDKLDQIWKSLRMTKQKMTSRDYVCILSSYLVLGHLREAGEIVDQWKQSVATDFDDSTCNRLLKAFSDAGLIENGKTLRVLLNEKAALPCRRV
ncbi:Pentatricopeptide repeat-containing protein [Actinidia chinensis var. chinensis]|uniref:Pentatricopeptide repeat-containing protein n=1 Tax=Actinidia chinensis var. chinensis TaxID=1590841 RepID=A0A2R6R218_ACTCC|nr:Pentatricopeptide repeat-containing protein [Actinidia chinensis var. chinensis]